MRVGDLKVIKVGGVTGETSQTFKQFQGNWQSQTYDLTLLSFNLNQLTKDNQEPNVNFQEFNGNLSPDRRSKHINHGYLILMIMVILYLTTLNILINESDINIVIISHPQTFNNSVRSECNDVSREGEVVGDSGHGLCQDWN